MVMFTKPRLKQSFKVEVIEPSLVFLLSEHRQLVFDGESYALLTPLLDGQHTLPDILTKVGHKLSLESIYTALAQMRKRDCLVEADGAPDPHVSAFWDYLTADPAGVTGRLQTTRVSVKALADVSVEMLGTAIANAGLRVAVGEAGDVLIIATDDYLRPELEALNHQALESGRPWLLLKPVGTVVWVGPMFRPGDTACWKCLEQRLSVNRQVEHFIRRHVAEHAPVKIARASLPSTIRVGMHLAATEVAKSLVLDKGKGLEGKILTLDLALLKMEEHTLVKRPQCPACGIDQSRDAAPVVLRPQPKPSWTQSDHRVAAAAETYERYKHHISPLTGIVTRLTSREPTESGPTHNYLAGHYFPMVSADLSVLKANLFARSGGKGQTEIEARTSALCEGLERYSGIAWGDEPVIRASYTALGSDAIHIRDLSLFSEAQYRDRERLNREALSDRHIVPEPFDETAEVAWSSAWSLTRQRVRYVPTAYCYYGHLDRGQYFTRCDSNGNAAGATFEDAILQGFLEVVERDSVAMWWYNRVRRPPVAADGFGLDYWEEMKRHYSRVLNRDLYALDVTADLEIPTFAVVSRRLDKTVEDIIIGFGSHLDPKTALRRALLEANQYLPSVRDANPDGSTAYRLYDEETVRWWKSATLDNQPYLAPDAGVPPKRLSDYASLVSGDVTEDVRTCVRLVERRGLETLVLDQTRPDIGLPVVKVIVPGMHHFWRRLAPGRLYNVPVQLGWLAQPVAESALNPISCFV